MILACATILIFVSAALPARGQTRITYQTNIVCQPTNFTPPRRITAATGKRRDE